MTTFAINNQTVEQFLQEQVKSPTDFLVNLVLKEIELREVKKDMESIGKDLENLHNGKIKLNTLDSLIKELNA